MQLRRVIMIGLAVALTFAGAADAKSHHYHDRAACHYGSSRSSSYYTNVSGHRVHRPVFSSRAPSGWSAQCSDGSYSFSEHHQGTCSHHGGISDGDSGRFKLGMSEQHTPQRIHSAEAMCYFCSHSKGASDGRAAT